MTDNNSEKPRKFVSKAPRGLLLRSQYVTKQCNRREIDRKELLVTVLEMARLLAAPSALDTQARIVPVVGDTVDAFIMETLAKCQADKRRAITLEKAKAAERGREARRVARRLSDSSRPAKVRTPPMTLPVTLIGQNAKPMPKWQQKLQALTPEQWEARDKRLQESIDRVFKADTEATLATPQRPLVSHVSMIDKPR